MDLCERAATRVAVLAGRVATFARRSERQRALIGVTAKLIAAPPNVRQFNFVREAVDIFFVCVYFVFFLCVYFVGHFGERRTRIPLRRTL